MAKSRLALRNEVKNFYTGKLFEMLGSFGEEVMYTKDHQLAFPITDSEGNEDFITITISIPTGANKGTEPYDGYAEAEDYQMKKRQKKEKAKAAAEAKQKKIARDEAYRAKKAAQKAAHHTEEAE